jgi:hypothetical protein
VLMIAFAPRLGLIMSVAVAAATVVVASMVRNVSSVLCLVPVCVCVLTRRNRLALR